MNNKVLMMDWPSFGGETVKRLLPELGYALTLFDFPYQSSEIRNGAALGERIARRLLESGADTVFSFNFYPVVAAAAHACRKRYVSWVYDSPSVLLYSMAVFFPENRIYHFDSEEAARMQREGVPHACYLPLGAAVKSYDEMRPDAATHRHYQADVAMIGSLYREERYSIFGRYEGFDDYVRGYLDALVAAQEQLYGVDVLEPALTDEMMRRIQSKVPLADESGDGYERPAWIYANYGLAKRVTARERVRLLQELSEVCDVSLYTLEPTPDLPRVRNLGRLDYYTEAPYAMKCARINLNVTLRSIHAGIPLRAMDILSCGGFLLSNYQADLCEAFVPGEDFVYYESVEDAVDKARYYLAHEEERQAIAASGHARAAREHSYEEKLRWMLRDDESET